MRASYYRNRYIEKFWVNFVTFQVCFFNLYLAFDFKIYSVKDRRNLDFPKRLNFQDNWQVKANKSIIRFKMNVFKVELSHTDENDFFHKQFNYDLVVRKIIKKMLGCL